MTNSKEKEFFVESNLLNTFKNVDAVKVIEYVKIHEPVSIWTISKELGVNRNSLYYLLKHLEFVGVVKSKISVNKMNRCVRLIYYNKKNGSDKNEKE